MNAFDAAVRLCGFRTHGEASEFLGIKLDTLKSWRTSRRPASPEAWRMLSELHDQIVNVSEDALDTFDLDDLKPDDLNDLAIEQYGDQLPAPALRAAIAMVLLTRMVDDCD